MASNQYYNKVIYGSQTLIDLTSDTITAADVINSKTFHLASGATATGSCTYDADTSDADAVAGEILATKTAYVNGSKVTGTMANNGGVTGYISDASTPYSIPVGYHDGSGTVGIAATELAKLIASNIREDITILGVTGTMSGTEAVTAASPTVTPYTTQKTYVPNDFDDDTHDYNYIAQFTVDAIATSEVDNQQGGKQITIGTVDPDA